MKRALILGAFLLAVMLMAAVGVMLGRALGGGGVGSQETDWSCVGRTSWLSAALELSPVQRAALEEYEREYQEVLATQCARHCAAKAKLLDGLFTPSAEAAATDPLLDAMAAAQRACECATLEHLRRVHSLLTPAQQQRFRSEVLAGVCACGTGLHGCQDAGNGSPLEGTECHSGNAHVEEQR